MSLRRSECFRRAAHVGRITVMGLETEACNIPGAVCFTGDGLDDTGEAIAPMEFLGNSLDLVAKSRVELLLLLGYHSLELG